jgi:hypothetical protein
MTTFDLRALLHALARADVKFVLIGGIAVAAHGHVRATEDADLVPDPAPANLDRLADVLLALHATLENGRPIGARERQALHRGRNLTAVTVHGTLDIVQRLPGVPAYARLDAAAVAADVLGTPVRICSLAQLREMKRARGSHQDLADLENLPEA